MPKKPMKYQARRPMPRIRTSARARATAPALTLGELIAAAYDTCGDTRTVSRVLGSCTMAERIGLHVIVG
ncbi:MAG: hypothetical protein INH41_03090 [Myxococcaceae bacterium]|jgi:hypothetical protein|nr:hypothetical protein [Myxococcaceae bacterium]MCA3011366.1 hypothetical protein [Myxococcaceae bacterium]